MDNYVSSSAVSSANVDSLVAAILGVGMFVFLIMLAVGIITIVGMWKILKKGNKPGWAALIPFYNSWCLCEVAGINPMWILIVLFAPILNIIPIIGTFAAFVIEIYFMILLYVSLARSFGKGDGFAAGLILLPPIFACILGLGSSEYIGPHPMKDIIFKNYQPQSNQNQSQPNVSATQGNVNQTTTSTETSAQKFCPACGSSIEGNVSFCPRCGKSIN